jgi:hypothetical protein
MPGIRRARLCLTLKNKWKIHFLEACYLCGFSEPKVGDEDRTHAIKPILLFPSPLFHCNKVSLHARNRDEEGDFHPL